jgi:hypothetical protein
MCWQQSDQSRHPGLTSARRKNMHILRARPHWLSGPNAVADQFVDRKKLTKSLEGMDSAQLSCCIDGRDSVEVSVQVDSMLPCGSCASLLYCIEGGPSAGVILRPFKVLPSIHGDRLEMPKLTAGIDPSCAIQQYQEHLIDDTP